MLSLKLFNYVLIPCVQSVISARVCVSLADVQLQAEVIVFELLKSYASLGQRFWSYVNS